MNISELGMKSNNPTNLNRTLKSAGKECFVYYFPLFNDKSLSNGEVAEIIKSERNYTDKACKSRTRHSRMIIDSGNLIEALKNIISSKKVTPSAVKSAEKYLNELL